MIYYFDELNQIDEITEAESDHRISASRLEYAAKYKSRSKRLECKMAFLLLREGLKREYGITEMPELIPGEHGKPFLKNTEHIFFNLSHTDGAVACGIARSEIGVDIQKIVPCNRKTAGKFMSDEELQRLPQTDADRYFTRIWTLKESYGKYKNMGICYDMKAITLDGKEKAGDVFVESFFLGKHYLSVVAEEKMEVIHVTMEELFDFYQYKPFHS